MNIWREALDVRFGDIDCSNRLTLWSIFSFFQEAAISHAAELGVGREAMMRKGQVWVLSRLSLFVERRPVYGEIIEVSTWPRGWDKLFALRDYEIKSDKGVTQVRGRGSWLVLDAQTRKPLRSESSMHSIPSNNGIDAFTSNPSGLDQKDELEKVSSRHALYSDIDFFGHMNNARYIQWIQDAADMEILTHAPQLRLDINYLSEVMPGEEVELWTGPLDANYVSESSRKDRNYPSRNGPGFAFEGRRPDSGKAVFRSELFTGG